MFKSSRNKDGHSAFTIHHDKQLREIVIDCKASVPYNPTSSPFTRHPPLVNVKALWDTGATNCAITKKLIDQLKLAPFDKVPVHHADGVTEKEVYKINLLLPNNILFPLVNVTQCESTAGAFDIIIGMSVITQGDFAITNVGGKSMVSFRIPSSVNIDFNDGETIISQPTKDTKDEKAKNPYSGTSRNVPCPCGSGKKYKHCHGKDD